jgi:hypothetical protein
MVAGPGQAQEGGVRARLAGGHLHPERGGPEGDGALEVGDEQDGVVEADRRDRRGHDGSRG